MPELPEVEAVCRKLRAEALGARIVQLRFERKGIASPQKAAAVERAASDTVLEAVERRGKNILIGLSNGFTLHIHLRMTGNLYVVPDVRFRPASTRAWFELEGGRGLVFDDSRALGKIHAHTGVSLAKVLARIGPEPLSESFSLPYLLQVAAKSRQPAKLFLMDQKHVAGLGNIYVAEALFRARISPKVVMARVRRPRLEALHRAIVEVLEEAAGSAVLAYSTPGGYNEAEGFACSVYDREGEPCLECGRAIRRIPQGGRSTYYCSTCQRL